MRHPALHSRSQTHAQRGHTLLEMILIILIVTLLVTMATVMFQQSLASQQVNAAAFRLSGDLTQAAQLAVTRNQTVALVFLKQEDTLVDEGARVQFRAWQLQAVNPLTGSLEPLNEPARLDTGIVFMDHADYSSILHRPRADGEPWEIRFKPGGGTDLPTGTQQHWCLTLAREVDVAMDASALPNSSRTLVVNAHTGMVTSY